MTYNFTTIYQEYLDWCQEYGLDSQMNLQSFYNDLSTRISDDLDEGNTSSDSDLWTMDYITKQIESDPSWINSTPS